MKKSTPWITIAEDTFHTPVSGGKAAHVAQPKKSSSSVQHKFFWGVGFAVVAVVSLAMLAPQPFNALIQGNLFDAPGVEAPELTQVVQPLGVLPASTPSEEPLPEPEEGISVNETVLQPETTPVEVQIKPLSPVSPTETPPAEEDDANQRLLEALRKQVGDLKTEKETPTAMLPVLPESYAPDLRPAAPAVGPAGAVEAAGVTAKLGQIPLAQGTYRLNPYRVAIRPEQVLQQNLGGGRVAYPPFVAAPYAPQAYAPRTDFNRVQGTPGSGPREMIALALVLTFFGLLVWKARRLAKS